MVGKKKALERFVVKCSFSRTRPDEVDLDQGDVVLVSAKFKDGWFKGIRLRGYKVGYFPEDFVEKESADASKSNCINVPPEQLSEAFCNSGPHGSNLQLETTKEPTELDGDSKRTKAAEEILSSEISYCNGLNLLVEHFIQPMRIYGVLSVEEIDTIFSNVESLAGISKELVAKLKGRLNQWDMKKTLIGDILVEMFFYLKMFKPYFDSRSAANRLRVRYEKSNVRFKSFLSRVNCEHTLDSLLLMPIQRIPRYELLLKELVKRTNPDHPDYESLSEALAKAQETAADLNEHIRQIENESKIFEIINMFPNDELNLLISDTPNSTPRTKRINSPSLPRQSRPNLEVDDGVRRSLSLTELDKPAIGHRMKHAPSDPLVVVPEHRRDDPKSHIFRTRMFIHEGPVQKVMFKNNGTTVPDSLGELSDRYLILFSDIAIVAVEAGNVITGNKLKLKERINLSQCWIATAESFLKKQAPPETFVLGTPRKTYTFVAPTVKDKITWERLLWQRISEEKQKLLQLWRNKPVPDAIFVKTTARSKVEYLSMNDSELDLQYGEDISVIGFRKGSLWIPGLYDADSYSYNFIRDWLPGVNAMGKFGWFPAECVPGNFADSKEKCVDQFTFVSVATALQIKQKMVELTHSVIPLKFLTSVKVYRADKTFRTCKLDEETTTDDVINHLDKHNRLCGLNIDKELIELWEESKDGTVKRKHKQNEKILEIISFWGEYQTQISFVARTRGMKESVETLIDPAIESTIERRQSRSGRAAIQPNGIGDGLPITFVKSASFSGVTHESFSDA